MLDPIATNQILNLLPERIRLALLAHAEAIEYPVEAVIEMAIASFLDSEAISFTDCKPNRGKSIK